MNSARPAGAMSRLRAESPHVTAALLDTDPVSAARLLLGGVLSCRGVSALIVEVEAYGGPPDGPWPDAAAHSFRGPQPAQRGDVRSARAALHLSQPRHPRLRQRRRAGRTARPRRCCCGRRPSSPVSTRPSVRRGPAVRPVALARGPGNLCSALGITMDDNGMDLFDTAVAGHRPTRRGRPGQPRTAGRRQHRPPTAPWRFWLTGRPEVSAYRRSPRAPGPGASD